MSLSDWRCCCSSRIRLRTWGSVGGGAGLLLGGVLTELVLTELLAASLLAEDLTLDCLTLDKRADVSLFFLSNDFFGDGLAGEVFEAFRADVFDEVGFMADATLVPLDFAVTDLPCALRLEVVDPFLVLFFPGDACPFEGFTVLPVAPPLVVAVDFCRGDLPAPDLLVDLLLATFDAFARAATNSSFLMEPIPETPSRFAILAKSALVCVFRSAVVIN